MNFFPHRRLSAFSRFFPPVSSHPNCVFQASFFINRPPPMKDVKGFILYALTTNDGGTGSVSSPLTGFSFIACSAESSSSVHPSSYIFALRFKSSPFFHVAVRKKGSVVFIAQIPSFFICIAPPGFDSCLPARRFFFFFSFVRTKTVFSRWALPCLLCRVRWRRFCFCVFFIFDPLGLATYVLFSAGLRFFI